MVDRSAVLTAVAAAFLAAAAAAHEGAHHPQRASPRRRASAGREALDYEREIKPIFAVKCMSCHARAKEPAWYEGLPGARKLFGREARVARGHFDVSDGYPFGGHGSDEEDLAALRKHAQQGTMPPPLYRLLHRGSALTPKEVETLLRWIDEAESSLRPSRKKA